jgi:hypothetical protein
VCPTWQRQGYGIAITVVTVMIDLIGKMIVLGITKRTTIFTIVAQQ